MYFLYKVAHVEELAGAIEKHKTMAAQRSDFYLCEALGTHFRCQVAAWIL